MTVSATSRLKVNPPLGRMPVLQMMMPAELAIDPAYQRSIEAKDSQVLIKRIAQHWNWDLCQPLVVSRRTVEGVDRYFVIDGQHRLEVARARGDIAQLPCVVNAYASAADEAASFVHLNQQRRPLGKLDVFRAAVASEDAQARAIVGALADAGLELAPHGNPTVWKPGQVANIGGIEQVWRKYGEPVAREALQCLGTAFAGEVLRYAGTLLPGIAAVCVGEMKATGSFDPGRFATFTAKLQARGQSRLREDVMLESASEEGLGRVAATVRVVTELWWPERRKNRLALQRASGALTSTSGPRRIAEVKRDHDGLIWCSQCDARVSPERAAGCESRFCKVGLG